MTLTNSFFTINNEVDDNETLAFEIDLNANHQIYKSHFPGNPITPGVILIKIVTELLSYKYGKKFELKGVSNIKYLSVLSPNDTTRVTYQLMKIDMNDDVCRLQVLVFNGENKYAKMSLIYAYA